MKDLKFVKKKKIAILKKRNINPNNSDTKSIKKA